MKICGLCGAGHIEKECPNCFPAVVSCIGDGEMNNVSRKLPNGDFEVIYTKEDPRPGKVEVLVNGKWYPRFPYEPYNINFAVSRMTEGLPDGPLPANHFNQK